MVVLGRVTADRFSSMLRTLQSAAKEKDTSGNQGFGSGSGLDLDSIRSEDPDPYSESVSGSRRVKMTHKSRKNVEIYFEVLDVLFGES